MGTDYGEKERAFIDGLKESSGRDLDEWMTAITQQNLPHRNDIIDWLRQQGFLFSKASWLERIHHNGGRPIYASIANAKPTTPRPRPDARAKTSPKSAFKPEPELRAASPMKYAMDNSLDALLAKAKAYRPLANYLIEQIKTIRPTARFEPRGTYVAIIDRVHFAALGIGTKELRLHLELGDYPPDTVVKKGVAGVGLGKTDALSHMIILTDARQVDAHVLGLVKRAAKKAND